MKKRRRDPKEDQRLFLVFSEDRSAAWFLEKWKCVFRGKKKAAFHGRLPGVIMKHFEVIWW